MENSVKNSENKNVAVNNKKDESSLIALFTKASSINAPIESSVSGANRLMYKCERQNLSSSDLRKKRNKYRKELNNMSFLFHCAVNKKDSVQINKIAKEFISYYKENYLINDFSLNSVRNRIENKTDAERIVLLLDYCKTLQA